MNNQIEVGGAPVISSDAKPTPHNPLHRPEIHYKKPIIFLSVFIVINLLIAFLVPGDFIVNKWIIMAVFSFIYICCIFKKTAIWLVRFYQNKAPDEVRLRCVFEPSCSVYMIMAIEKYGAIRGIYKGIRRLLRCHPPNGGEDYP